MAVKKNFFLPCRSGILERNTDATDQPAKYIAPIRPIVDLSSPREVLVVKICLHSHPKSTIQLSNEYGEDVSMI